MRTSLLVRILLGLYTCLYYVILPIILLRLVWRSKKNPAYRVRWQERLGFVKSLSHPNSIWIHAVSVGETIAAVPLVKKLFEQYPDYQIVMTSTTPTGSTQVLQHLKDHVTHYYAPYDVPRFVKRFLKRTHPKLCIILETEIWPNLLQICQQQQIPVLLANARLSPVSYKNYAKIKNCMKSILSAYSKVAAQSLLDGERLLALGLDPKKLDITGNLKFDVESPSAIIAEGKALRQTWQATDRPVFIAASTHEGEEKIVLESFAHLREKNPNLLLILAPRHPERFKMVLRLCQENYQTAKRSTQDIVNAETDIFLGDTLGELKLLYACADIAFVGGSLVPVGGHNLLEPAVLSLPTLTGPELHNFKEIGELLTKAGATQIIKNSRELTQAVEALLDSPSLRKSMGQQAQQVVAANQGALKKHLEIVAAIFSSRKN